MFDSFYVCLFSEELERGGEIQRWIIKDAYHHADH